MRRILIVAACIALVAGCGGGGGGGSTPPTTVTAAPGSPTPPASTPSPTTKPTATPTGKPSTSPSPTTRPTGSPTALPTNSPTVAPPTPPPTPTATPTPTAKPTPTATPTASPTPTSITPGWSGNNLSTEYEYTNSKTGVTHAAVINGQVTTAFNPPSQYGDTPSGGHGPIGNVVDNVPCEVEMSNNYHIHVFIGIYYNGQEIALPTGTGVVEPVIDSYGDDNYGTQCFYFTHTHDSTGVVHVESDNGGVVEPTPTDSKFVLGQYLQVWGITATCPTGVPGCMGQFGPFNGPIEVFTSGQVYRGSHTPGWPVTKEQDLTPWYGDPNSIPLYSHEVIWFLIGPNYPSTLPGVKFAEEF